jgi:hypothetical protein
LDAFNWEASLVKTSQTNGQDPFQHAIPARRDRPTQTWRKQHHVEVRQELLLVGIEMAQAGDDIAGQADADHFQHCAEDEQREVVEGRVRIDGCLLLEDDKGRGGRRR